MKILMVCNRFNPWSGAEIIAIKSYEYLLEKGHELFFFAAQEKKTADYYIKNYEYAKFFPKMLEPQKWGYLKHLIKFYYDGNSEKCLAKMIKTVQPDLIHLHTIGLFTNSILNQLKNIPTVMTIHSPYQVFCPAATGMRDGKICTDCKNGNYISCVKYKCFNSLLIERNMRMALRGFVYKNTFKNIDYFTTPSDALKEYVLECNAGIDKEKIETVPNFISKKLYVTNPNYENKGYFLYAGRLAKEKGVEFILQALKDLPREIKLHIAGTGGYENELKKYAEENDLSNVVFLGHLSTEKLKEEYQNSIATIVPSNWFEIFGLVNIESFINGKPVIASNIGGIPEIVDDNINGLLFEPTNVEQLKQHILMYWNNPQLVIQHGKNGYEKAKNNYSIENYHEKIIKIYEKTINEYRK